MQPQTWGKIKWKMAWKKTNSSSSSRSWKRAGECVEVDGKVEKTRNNLNRKYIARHSQNKSIIPKNTALSSCSHGLQTFTFFQSLSLLLVYYNSWYFLFLCWHRRWLHAAVALPSQLYKCEFLVDSDTKWTNIYKHSTQTHKTDMNQNHWRKTKLCLAQTDCLANSKWNIKQRKIMTQAAEAHSDSNNGNGHDSRSHNNGSRSCNGNGNNTHI